MESMTQSQKEFCEDRVAIILRLLGLEGCADTPVGNELLRGISGGEVGTPATRGPCRCL